MSKKNVLLATLAAVAGVSGVAATATDASAQTAPAPAPTVTTSWSGAPRTNEEDRQFKVNGRIQYDYFNIDQDLNTGADSAYSGSFARRVFLGVEGRFTQQWRYNVKVDLAPGISGTGAETNEVRLDDAYLEYAGQDFSLVIGQNNAISHMEDRTSSNYTPFNERSMIDQAFGFGKIMGVGLLWSGGNWSLGGEYYMDTLNNPQTVNTDEQQAFAVRGTWAPIYSRTPDGVTLLHLGAYARHRDSGTTALSYSARPAQNSLTGFGATVSSQGSWKFDDVYGVEVAGQWNQFGATVEYMENETTRSGAPPAGLPRDGSISGGYVDLFWGITGESRNYIASDGSWGRITPRRTLGSDGGIGAVWLTGRYEWLDMSDRAYQATSAAADGRGEETGYNLGLTWAPIAYVKFQLNHGIYELDRPGTANDQETQSTTLRMQFDW